MALRPVVSAALIALASQACDAAECMGINTTLSGSIVACAQSPMGLCAPATAVGGILKGPKNFVFAGLAPSAGLAPVEPGTVLSYTGPLVYHTGHGELHLDAIGILDQARLVFTEIQRVTGGTGRFAGATGDLFVSGDSPGVDDSGAFPFEGRVTGEVCLAR